MLFFPELILKIFFPEIIFPFGNYLLYFFQNQKLLQTSPSNNDYVINKGIIQTFLNNFSA